MPLLNVGRQTFRLRAEDEHHIARLTQWCIPVESLRSRREKVRLAERFELLLERTPARPDAQVDVLPVVQARSPDLAFIERKTERLDEMQCRARGEATAARIAGVPVNFRVDENDVYGQSSAVSGSWVVGLGASIRRAAL